MKRLWKRRPWLVVYGAVIALVTALTWTVLRPHLVLTDGMPTATDPFTPLGVALVNIALVFVACAVVAVLHGMWWLGRSSDRR